MNAPNPPISPPHLPVQAIEEYAKLLRKYIEHSNERVPGVKLFEPIPDTARKAFDKHTKAGRKLLRQVADKSKSAANALFRTDQRLANDVLVLGNHCGESIDQRMAFSRLAGRANLLARLDFAALATANAPTLLAQPVAKSQHTVNDAAKPGKPKTKAKGKGAGGRPIEFKCKPEDEATILEAHRSGMPPWEIHQKTKIPITTVKAVLDRNRK